MNRPLIVSLAAIAVTAATVFPLRGTNASTASTDSGCGIERAAVKHLTDQAASSVNLTPKLATVQQLSAIAAPHNAYQRLPAEKQAYTVTAYLTGYKQEADSDLHAVIDDGTGRTMIVELVDPRCAPGSRVLTLIGQARTAFLNAHSLANECFRCLHQKVTVSGVLFLDRIHGQTGVAPNGVELHPVTAFNVSP